jgi:hypothetical protein
VGGALLVIAMIILVPSGLCTTLLGVFAIGKLLSNPQELVKDIVDTWPLTALVVGPAIGAIVLIRIAVAIRGRD